MPVIERFDAETISRGEQAFGMFVPYGKRKHSIQCFEALRPPLFVCVEDDFRVGVGSKTVPLIRQYSSYLTVVINLTIVRNPETAFRIGHWLVSQGGEIENTQTRVAECDPSGLKEFDSRVVWSAMRERLDHTSDRFPL